MILYKKNKYKNKLFTEILYVIENLRNICVLIFRTSETEDNKKLYFMLFNAKHYFSLSVQSGKYNLK